MSSFMIWGVPFYSVLKEISYPKTWFYNQNILSEILNGVPRVHLLHGVFILDASLC